MHVFMYVSHVYVSLFFFQLAATLRAVAGLLSALQDVYHSRGKHVFFLHLKVTFFFHFCFIKFFSYY